MKISIILSSTALAVAILGSTPLGQAALGGPDRAAQQTKGTASTSGIVISEGTVALKNDDVGEGKAACPAGTKVFGGGYAIEHASNAHVFVAGPSRKQNGYLAYAYKPPVNIVTGVGKETGQINVYAWCAPVGKPIVLG